MLSLESQSYLISGMGNTTSGNNLISAINNSTALSAGDFTRLQDCFGEDDVASNFQACILGTYALSPRDVQFVQTGFSLPASALASVLGTVAGGVQQTLPGQFLNSSPVNVSMPTGFSFAILSVGPAGQQTNVFTFPAGSVFASTGTGQYFELYTGANAHKYYVWYDVDSGNSDPAPATFTGIKVAISASDVASAVATKTNAALAAVNPGSQLGVASSYAVLAATAVTGSTSGDILVGNLGIYPGTGGDVTNYPPGTYTGTLNAGNAAAEAAQAAALAAYTAMQALSATTIPAELGGQTLAPGVYKSSGGTFTFNGSLTLTGSSTDVYVFQTTSTFIGGASNSGTMSLGSVLAANVYFVVGTTAALSGSGGHHCTLQGNLIANGNVTNGANGNSQVHGTVVSLTGSVVCAAAAVLLGTAQTAPPAGPVLAGASSTASGTNVTVALQS